VAARISPHFLDFLDFGEASLSPEEAQSLVRGLFPLKQLGPKGRGLTYQPGDRVELEIRFLSGSVEVTRGIVYEADTTAPNLLGGAQVLATAPATNGYLDYRDGERGGMVRILRILMPANTPDSFTP
jgi:hypothetical protein